MHVIFPVQILSSVTEKSRGQDIPVLYRNYSFYTFPSLTWTLMCSLKINAPFSHWTIAAFRRFVKLDIPCLTGQLLLCLLGLQQAKNMKLFFVINIEEDTNSTQRCQGNNFWHIQLSEFLRPFCARRKWYILMTWRRNKHSHYVLQFFDRGIWHLKTLKTFWGFSTVCIEI